MSIRVTYGTALVEVEAAVVVTRADGLAVENYQPSDLAAAVATVVRSWGNMSIDRFCDMLRWPDQDVAPLPKETDQ